MDRKHAPYAASFKIITRIICIFPVRQIVRARINVSLDKRILFSKRFVFYLFVYFYFFSSATRITQCLAVTVQIPCDRNYDGFQTIIRNGRNDFERLLIDDEHSWEFLPISCCTLQ